MQFKLVPTAPDDLAYVETVQRAVPLVPGSEDDCCARIMRRTEIAPRDEARTWLTFLRALELAEEGASGFTRTRRDPEPEHLRDAFCDRLYGVDRLLEILAEADGPLSSKAVFDRFRDDVPAYEQYRWSDRLEEVWSERVERLLEWAVLLDLVDRDEDGYRFA
ncbi:hypothetical protein OB955_19075 [Halobacteria archaeon AArc-m2/3/4]|uniref:Uncharacterized protein n=1 Tax=Natronoglomus mannanivorans TaxID=2979990 RepID=A0ABT2QIT5_9EURY|nr:hypothetical protein [Halobacteria archaeon AArc-m2/3/4]